MVKVKKSVEELKFDERKKIFEVFKVKFGEIWYFIILLLFF